MKKESHDLTEPVDKRQYKKRYLVRKIQEQEAEKEVKEFQPEDLDGMEDRHPI